MDNFGSNYDSDLEWTWIFDHFEMIGHEMPKRFAAAVNGCGFLLAQAWCCSEREKNCSSLPWQSSRSAKKRPGCMACEVSKKCCNIKKWLTYESKLLQSGWTLSSWEGLIRTAGVWGAVFRHPPRLMARGNKKISTIALQMGSVWKICMLDSPNDQTDLNSAVRS